VSLLIKVQLELDGDFPFHPLRDMFHRPTEDISAKFTGPSEKVEVVIFSVVDSYSII